MSYKIPILLIIFNRPAETSAVFNIIKNIKPEHLFVAADGPRVQNDSDTENCKKTRELINVDWECNFHTLYQDENKGCGLGPAEAINWFFDNVDEGIILEDDIIPGPGFFEFMEFALTQYHNNNSVNMVTGLNLAQKWKFTSNDYFFSKYGGTAGWGTWKREWNQYKFLLNLSDIDEYKYPDLKKNIKSKKHYLYFKNLFNKTLNASMIDFWDYQWLYTRLSSGGYSIVPRENLIKNIGFGENATHTQIADHPQAFIKHGKIDFPLKLLRPSVSRFYDWYIFERFMNPSRRSLIKKIILKLIKITLTT